MLQLLKEAGHSAEEVVPVFLNRVAAVLGVAEAVAVATAREGVHLARDTVLHEGVEIADLVLRRNTIVVGTEDDEGLRRVRADLLVQ